MFLIKTFGIQVFILRGIYDLPIYGGSTIAIILGFVESSHHSSGQFITVMRVSKQLGAVSELKNKLTR